MSETQTEYGGKMEPTIPIVRRRAVCAAIQSPNGAIICSPRHYDPLMHAQLNMVNPDNKEWKDRSKIVQGFVDQWGRFMDRETALRVATDAGQIIRRCGGDNRRLYSENLY